jgi:Icc-related predicted phosphoesterase
MRLLFLSDFHGHMPDVSRWRPDLVVAGGDYCEVDEIRQLKFEAMARGLHATKWTELVGEARANDLIDRALAEGSAVVAALAECGVPVLAIPGNSDRVGLYSPELAAKHVPRPDHPDVAGRVTDIETRLIVRRDLAFAGLGGWSGPANPERLDREVAALEAMSRPAAAPLVLVSHNVPFGSSLDGVNNPDLPDFAQGKMVGSHRCRAVMAALSPSLCLAGHLHENYGRTERIGETLCVCGAGAYRGDAVIIEFHSDGSFDEPEFVSSPAGARRVLT